MVETHKHPSLDQAIRATLKNVGIELIEYKSCTIHPPVDQRMLYIFSIT